MDHRPTGSGLHRAWELWSRRKWLALLAVVGVFAPVLTIARSLPDIYRATATILVEHQPVAEAFVRPAEGAVRSFWTNELETRLHTISQEIMSRARLWELISRFGLYPKLQSVSPEAAVERMRADIKLERRAVGETGVWGATVAFTLGYRGTDARTVAEVTNALASAYVEQNLTIRAGQAISTTRFLQAQLETAAARLSEHEARIKDFKERHGSELPERFTANLSVLERLNAMVRVNSDNQLRALERRAALARDLAEQESPRGGDTPAARLVRLRLELLELRQRFTDQYPEVIRVKTELAALERALAKADPNGLSVPTPLRLRQMLSELDAETRSLKGQEERLRRELAAYRRGLEHAPQREQQFQALTRDYDAARELHASLSKRYEDALLAEQVERRKGAQFRLLDPAIPSPRPAGPNRQLLVLYGLMLALGTAGAAVLLAERLDTSLHTIDDLRARTPGPVLVSIPRIITGAEARRHRQRVALAAIAVTLALALIVGACAYVAHGNEQLASLFARGR